MPYSFVLPYLAHVPPVLHPCAHSLTDLPPVLCCCAAVLLLPPVALPCPLPVHSCFLLWRCLALFLCTSPPNAGPLCTRAVHGAVCGVCITPQASQTQVGTGRCIGRCAVHALSSGWCLQHTRPARRVCSWGTVVGTHCSVDAVHASLGVKSSGCWPAGVTT
jgi:hypothetical protein